jgi:nucleotide-binding universal stress UspA family protein
MKDYLATPPKITRRRIFTVSAPVEFRRPVQIKTILAPVDFSQESFRALEYCILIAKKFGAVVHVVNIRPSKEASAIERTGNLLCNYTDALAFLQDRLAEVQEKHDVKFSPANCHVEAGRPYEKICGVARETAADLIVMATRGESGLKHLLLGSTTERVIRFAPSPVLVARGKSYKAALALGEKSKLKMRNILVPVDFSECSLTGVRYAAFLAKCFAARLKLLHVVGRHDHDYAFASKGFEGEITRLTEVARERAKKQMTELCRSSLLQGVSCESEIPIGNAITEICRRGAQDDADLIVISTHGRSGFRRTLIGSVAEQVARYAEHPVLIVPSRERKE